MRKWNQNNRVELNRRHRCLLPPVRAEPGVQSILCIIVLLSLVIASLSGCGQCMSNDEIAMKLLDAKCLLAAAVRKLNDTYSDMTEGLIDEEECQRLIMNVGMPVFEIWTTRGMSEYTWLSDDPIKISDEDLNLAFELLDSAGNTVSEIIFFIGKTQLGSMGGLNPPEGVEYETGENGKMCFYKDGAELTEDEVLRLFTIQVEEDLSLADKALDEYFVENPELILESP